MKKQLAVFLLLATSCFAVDGKSLLIGISIGLGVYTYHGTRDKIIRPVGHAVQRAVRPIPQDRTDKLERKRLKKEKQDGRKTR